MPKHIDVQIHGSARIGFYRFELLTEAARAWVTARFGPDELVCDDTRCAQEIADGMIADGLKLI